MAKGKLATPDWIKEGYDSKEEYEKKKGIKGKKKEGKIFKIRKCPKCGSDKVQVVLTGELELDILSDSSKSQIKEGSDEDELLATSSKRGQSKGSGEWECLKCKWTGRNVSMEEVSEDEFMKYLDEKGEEIP